MWFLFKGEFMLPLKCTFSYSVMRTKHSVPGCAFLSSPRGCLPVEVLSLAGQVGQQGWAAGAAAGLWRWLSCAQLWPVGTWRIFLGPFPLTSCWCLQHKVTTTVEVWDCAPKHRSPFHHVCLQRGWAHWCRVCSSVADSYWYLVETKAVILQLKISFKEEPSDFSLPLIKPANNTKKHTITTTHCITFHRRKCCLDRALISVFDF